MIGSPPASELKSLALTEYESTALLDICLTAEIEYDAIKERALERVSAVCRESVCAEQGASASRFIGSVCAV